MRISRGVAAVTVAVLLLIGVGGAPRVMATPPPPTSSFVPITPCRLMDTRSTSSIGPRHTPIAAGETYSALVWGTNGNCTIPVTARAITLNVTFVSPTSSGFVTVYPPDQAWPGTSNLNFTAGQAPAPNGVTSPLSFDGKIGFFNAAGTVDLIADIVGYYEDAGASDADLVIGACSAQLRWDLDRCAKQVYATGSAPSGVAFDGTSLWITNKSSHTVSKMNPATGSKVDYSTGVEPVGVAFDGTSIWVANNGSATVSKVNTATGSRADYATGAGAYGVAFDGTSVWVTNSDDNTVSKINPATGATVGTFATGSEPHGVVFDGSSLWIANYADSSVSKMNPSTGAKVDFPTTGAGSEGIAFDGTSIWVANLDSDNVSKLNPTTGAVQGLFTAGDAPWGVAFDGTKIWVSISAGDVVSTFNPATGARADYATADFPTAVAFDGSNIWVASSGGDRISKFVAGRGVLEIDPVGSSDSSAFVPITPCRLMDTRAGAQIGPRGTPITAGETYSALVWGSNGNCTIPTTATAVSLNVTFVGPTSSGFVTVFPPDQPWPGTSNLNFSAGQAPAPNGVTSPLSFDGKIGFFNAAGTVNLIADVVGYYEVAGSAPGGLVTGNCSSLLRWDLPGCRAGSFATGNNPSGIAFDGHSIWIANEQDNTVSKFNPTTGTKVDYPTGTTPTGVAFDGSNIWVANTDSDTVSKFNTATGARTDFATDALPTGVAFDGTNVWVTTQGNDMVSKINPANGATVATYETGTTPWGLAFDGTSLWIANYNDNSVSKMNPADGTKVDYPTGFNPIGVAFDGSRVWVTNLTANTVSRIDPLNGFTTTHTTGLGPRGIAFDGTNIWIANQQADTVSRVNISDGSRVDLPTGDESNGVVFDGGNIWVTNTIGKTVTKLIPTRSALRLSGVASEGSTSFVPITPCRLMDTRSTSSIGPRHTPIGAGETYSALVWGTNGNCTVPSSATALSMNVTFVGPTSDGFATVYPPDKPWPGTSNLNFSAGQAPAPNGVTSPLSFDGKIGFFNAAGTVNMLADIVGYYEPIPTITTRCLPVLRWDLTACEQATIASGDNPFGIASDGTYLWVANGNGAGSVSKIDPVTGSSTEFPTGSGSYGVVFDGTNIWVTNTGIATVSKIDPADGSEIAEYATQTAPRMLAFDGTSIWIANETTGSVSKMNPVDGTRVDIATGAGAWGVAFDGTFIYVTNSDDDTVSKVDPFGETVVDTFTVGDFPEGIAFDGTNLWIANVGNASDSVMRMDPVTGDTDEYPIGDGLSAFAFDGTSMWVVSQNSSSIARIDVTTGVATHVTVSSHVYGIVFDGENIWYTRYLFDEIRKLVI